MASVQQVYPATSRSNFDQDLSPIVTIPNGITSVDAVGVQLNSKNGSNAITFLDPVNMHITVIWYKSLDGGATWQEFAEIMWNGGCHAGHNDPTIIDPFAEYYCTPSLLPGTKIKVHITQSGTFWLGGTLYATYTP